jgi:hypothetical protein
MNIFYRGGSWLGRLSFLLGTEISEHKGALYPSLETSVLELRRTKLSEAEGSNGMSVASVNSRAFCFPLVFAFALHFFPAGSSEDSVMLRPCFLTEILVTLG